MLITKITQNLWRSLGYVLFVTEICIWKRESYESAALLAGAEEALLPAQGWADGTTAVRIPTITLHNTDCLPAMREMGDNQFDLAIVDPPYGLGLAMIDNGAHGTKQKRKEKQYKPIHDVEKSWNNAPPGPEYFKELHRVTKNQIIWGCNYYAQYIPAVGRIYHDKETGLEGTKINFSHGDLASCSLQKRITCFRYRWSGNKQGDTINWYNTGLDARIHPTQKPVALYKWLLRNYAKEGDTILDTHLGSGSIAIACHDYGFDLTCYELDAEYYAAAVKRLDDHRSQMRLDLT